MRPSINGVSAPQAMRAAADRQARLIAEVDERRRVRATVVPTAIPEVKALLRELGEPTTLFGEGPVRTPKSKHNPIPNHNAYSLRSRHEPNHKSSYDRPASDGKPTATALTRALQRHQ